jgi:hypothetical protein
MNDEERKSYLFRISYYSKISFIFWYYRCCFAPAATATVVVVSSSINITWLCHLYITQSILYTHTRIHHK